MDLRQKKISMLQEQQRQLKGKLLPSSLTKVPRTISLNGLSKEINPRDLRQNKITSLSKNTKNLKTMNKKRVQLKHDFLY